MSLNLPGYRVELVDGGLVVNVSEVTSDLVLLIGFSATGQDSADAYAFQTPLKINTLDAAEEVWGSASDGSTLTRGIYEALGGGATEVWSFNLGQWGTAQYHDALSDVYYDLFTANGDGTYSVNDDNMYKALDYVYDLLRDFNADILWPIDVNAFDEVTVSGRTTCFAYQLANACYRMTSENNECRGAIAVEPATSGTMAIVRTYIGTSPTTNFEGTITANGTGLLGEVWQAGAVDETVRPGFYASTFDEDSAYYGLPPVSVSEIKTDRRGKRVDIGKHLDIVAYEPRYTNAAYSADDIDQYYGTGVGAYVGLVSTLAPQSAPTNKVLAGIGSALRYNLSRSQLTDMINARYITAKATSRGVCVVDGVSAARTTSDYARVQTDRIVLAISKMIRVAVEPYYGEPMSKQMEAALSTTVDGVLKKFVKNQALKGYVFKIQHSATDDVIGRMVIYLTLAPTPETREISVVIDLTNQNP